MRQGQAVLEGLALVSKRFGPEVTCFSSAPSPLARTSRCPCLTATGMGKDNPSVSSEETEETESRYGQALRSSTTGASLDGRRCSLRHLSQVHQVLGEGVQQKEVFQRRQHQYWVRKGEEMISRQS